MKQLSKFRNLVELLMYFKSNTECLAYLKTELWKCEKPSACPRCGHTKSYAYADKHTYRCSGCKKKFNILTNTIYENTKIPLNKWFAAIWLCSSYKRGVSSVQLAKEVGVTQKTGWFMIQRMRVMFTNMQPETLEGLVCADECFVGGKNKNRHYNKRFRGYAAKGMSEKINVFGVLEIGGRVKSISVPNVQRGTLLPLIRKFVKPDSTLMTDEDNAYSRMPWCYNHKVCNHQRYEYVSPEEATTNPIENYWSHVKRAVIGTYYHISRKHIDRYLAEFDYKFNTRNETDESRFILTIQNSRGRLKYNELIAKSNGKEPHGLFS